MRNYVSRIIEEMGLVYPELRDNRSTIEHYVNAEEERFNQTLRLGQNYLDAHLAQLTGDERVLSGKDAFELHDTYGFPIDLTIEIAAELGVGVDREGFEAYMNEQRQRGRDNANDDAWGSVGSVFGEVLAANGATEFMGYVADELEATIAAIVVEATDSEAASTQEKPDKSLSQFCQVESISSGQKAQIVLDKTPFYGEKGGQVGDIGLISTAGAVFKVSDTKIFESVVTAHVGEAQGTLNVGDKVHASIDRLYRERIERNHTATHLLHQALRDVLGDHVKQAGSLVAADRLRFDFTHFEAVTTDQLSKIEAIVNKAIMEDIDTHAFETSLESARESGVTALFGEKYGDNVRVLEIGSTSRELCGGTHVKHTAEIGFIKIISESSVGASMRRIEALTSFDALQHVNHIESELRTAAGLLKTPIFEVHEKIEALQNRVAELNAALKRQQASGAADQIDALATQVIDNGYALVVARIDGSDIEGLRAAMDSLRNRLGTDGKGVGIVLGAKTSAGTPALVAAGNKEAVEAGFDAAAIIKHISPAIKGGGGGKAQMAQAGGKDVEGIDKALDMARELLIETKKD